LGAGTYADNGVITYQSQQVEVSIGVGELKWSEKKQYKYDLDKGYLDTVRRGDDVPMEVTIDCKFDQVKSGTGEAITPMEAIKGEDAAAEWVSSAADKCEPYALDVVVEDARPCAGGKTTYVFPAFRAEGRDYSIKNATIAVTGKCNATEPEITRES